MRYSAFASRLAVGLIVAEKSASLYEAVAATVFHVVPLFFCKRIPPPVSSPLLLIASENFTVIVFWFSRMSFAPFHGMVFSTLGGVPSFPYSSVNLIAELIEGNETSVAASLLAITYATYLSNSLNGKNGLAESIAPIVVALVLLLSVLMLILPVNEQELPEHAVEANAATIG